MAGSAAPTAAVLRQDPVRWTGLPFQPAGLEASKGVITTLSNTSATDFYPIEQEQLARFDGERWVRFGEIYDAGKK